MRIVAIIQARMGSTRLPGKVLKLVNRKPLLAYQLERLKSSKFIDEIVISTTTKKSDDEIEAFCIKNSVSYYRGSETDVLERYYETAVKFQADIIIRITSDCPLIDSQVVDKVIKYYIDNQNLDYVANTIHRTYPRGLDTEVFSFKALKHVHSKAFLERDREHVTAYFYSSNGKFKIGSVQNDKDYSKYRWTVDTAEDFELIKLIIETLYNRIPNFGMIDVINLMEQKPDLYYINSHIVQKKL